MIVQLRKEFRFEASHQLPNHDGKCARLHGHSWRLVVEVAGHINEKEGHVKEGMVMDYGDIKSAVDPVINMLDHRHLGSGQVLGSMGKVRLGPDPALPPGFPSIPTSENLLIWIASWLPQLPWTSLELNETCTVAAVLRRPQEGIWIPN